VGFFGAVSFRLSFLSMASNSEKKVSPLAEAMAIASLSELQRHVKASEELRLEQFRLFYGAVGQGISRWSSMEETLVQIAAKLVRTSEPKAGAIMYSINNFYAWLQIIDDLFVLDDTFPKSLKRWRGMIETLKKANDTRVRLAHHAVHEDLLPLLLGASAQADLRPGRLDTRSKTGTLKPLKMKEVIDFTDHVAVLHERLKELLFQMKKRKSLR
jgi:hypothetical protein